MDERKGGVGEGERRGCARMGERERHQKAVVDLTADESDGEGARAVPSAARPGGSAQRKPDRRADVVLIDSDDDAVDADGGRGKGRRDGGAAMGAGMGNDDDDCEVVAAPVPSKRARTQQQRPRNSLPSWAGMQGPRRLAAEFRALMAEIDAGNGGAMCGPARLRCLEYLNDNMRVWRLALADFDGDTAEGAQLNADLRAFAQQHPRRAEHGAAVTLELRFPEDYPNAPFFLRLVRPRMQMYTGHVTAGGAICIQALTQGSAPACWKQSFSVSGVLATVATNMIDPERVMVRTRTGPGGLSGPARVDVPRAAIDYSDHEAREAFRRMEAHHRENGWG